MGEDEDGFECPNCRLIECFYKKLNLSEEELKKVRELEDDPKEAIKYLQSIRTDKELREAWKSCTL